MNVFLGNWLIWSYIFFIDPAILIVEMDISSVLQLSYDMTAPIYLCNIRHGVLVICGSTTYDVEQWL